MRPSCRSRSTASSAGDGMPLTTVPTNLCDDGMPRAREHVEHVAVLDHPAPSITATFVAIDWITSISW